MANKSPARLKVEPTHAAIDAHSDTPVPGYHRSSDVSKLNVHPFVERSRNPVGYLPSDPRTEPTFPPKARARTLSIGYEVSKRVFDLIVGFILLALSAPVVIVAAICIRLGSPGSPIFVQTRLGKNGVPFKIYKLRGMFIDARERFPAYYDYSQKKDLEFCFHQNHDPRVTKQGRFFRRTSIDELPNLWNVVLGDMSLVGPRPEIPEVLALYGNYRLEYLSVKPGVTCFSKCTGRDRLTKRETIEFDIDYVRRRNFTVDIMILWKTFCGVVLRRDVC